MFQHFQVEKSRIDLRLLVSPHRELRARVRLSSKLYNNSVRVLCRVLLARTSLSNLRRAPCGDLFDNRVLSSPFVTVPRDGVLHRETGLCLAAAQMRLI